MSERLPVDIVAYEPEWRALYVRERAILTDVFAGTDAAIEHVGSTAVRGLPAKPIIDIMIGVADLADVTPRIDALAAHGYQYVPEYEAQIPDRRYFRKPPTRPRRYHLHVAVLDGEFWSRHLLFRDYLRNHAEVALAYGRVKRRLATTHGRDHAAYTDAKTPFIEAALAAARAAHRPRD